MLSDCNVTVSDNGRIVLPVIFRKQLNIKPGDELVLSISSENDIIIHSPKQSLQKLQNLASKKGKKNLVNAVIDMRRKEKL
ncbi:MAG: AbrB/MazE/SpoVT family DNA-binding domain-containing protein [Rickettsiales bacterium]|nr:AbrB/MazE/SpoVT family DNA-binding domain-containing protein [Rickettsiales bacterium]